MNTHSATDTSTSTSRRDEVDARTNTFASNFSPEMQLKFSDSVKLSIKSIWIGRLVDWSLLCRPKVPKSSSTSAMIDNAQQICDAVLRDAATEQRRHGWIDLN